MANRSKKDVITEAQRLGLYVAEQSPGDGVTHYRFFEGTAPKAYFSGDGIFTALGVKEAATFLRGKGTQF